MAASSPEDPTRGYEIPIVLHGISEFDVAADLGCKDFVPVGEFTRCEHIHPLTEFDCSQPVEKGERVALRLIYDVPAGESSSVGPAVSELLYELHEYDKKLGGAGLDLDPSASRGGDGRLSLVLRPNDQQGAADRFRRMAEQLESPITEGLPECLTDLTPNRLLADVVSRWEKTGLQPSRGVAGTADLTTSCNRLREYGMRQRIILSVIRFSGKENFDMSPKETPLPPQRDKETKHSSWVWLRSSLPSFGVVVTGGLILLIAWSLLSKVDHKLDDMKTLRLRILPDRQDEEKQADKVRSVQPPKEAGTVEKSIENFGERTKYLDVMARQQAFLSIWAVVNLVQAALTIVVFVLSIMTIVQFTPRRHWIRAVGLPAMILIIAVGLIFFIDGWDIIHVRLNKSLLNFLQDSIRQKADMKEGVNLLTTLGNISVALVVIVTPISVGVLLLGPAQNIKIRRERFQELMYWTACLLVAGVIQVTYQSRWPSLFFDDETSIQSIGQMAAGAGLLMGAVFTVASGLVFLPAGFLLNRQDVASAEPAPAASSNKNSLTEIFAILAPVLTALPIAKLFELIH